MTQFDTYATPMVESFGDDANLDPFTALVPPDAGNDTNGVDAPMASVSARQQLDREDQINERTFNEAIWKSVKGADSRCRRRSTRCGVRCRTSRTTTTDPQVRAVGSPAWPSCTT